MGVFVNYSMFTAYRELVYVKLLLPFVAGILLAIYLPISIAAAVVAMLCSLTAVLWLTRQKQPLTPNREWVSGLPIQILLLSLGYLTTNVHTEINDSRHFSRYYLSEAPWVAQLAEPPTLLDSTYRIKANVVTVFQAKKPVGATGKIILYLPQDGKSEQLKYGDLIGLSAPIKETAIAANPYEFDRKTYYSWQQYYHQAMAYPNQWKPLGVNHGNMLLRWIYAVRACCVERLAQHLQGEPLAVTAALLLGYRDFMDNELTQIYSAAGVVHILSVSGMHLGLVVVVWMWLVGLLRLPYRYSWIKYLTVILAVWAFAGLTGFTPSVLRAAVIASFILIGKLLRRDMHPLNGLAASAFFLFLIDPYLLMDIGFQLSYLAVVGILLMYPALYRRGMFKHKVPQWIYQSVVLSICATVATLPLTLYYFHQASVYFVLSNLVVVPMSAAVMIGGAVMLLSPIAKLATYAAVATNYLVMWMNNTVTWIAHLPLAQVKGIALLKEETLLLGIAIVLLMVFVYSRRTGLLFVSLAIFIIFLGYGIDREIAQPYQSKLVVYSVNRHTAVELIEGKHDLLIADDSLLQNNNAIDQHINPMRWYAGLGEPIRECVDEDSSQLQWQTAWRNGRYLQIHDKRILLLSSWKRLIPPTKKLQVDYLILIRNAEVKLRDLSQSVAPKLVIIDAANSQRKAESMIDQCRDLGWQYYDTRKQGAWIMDFNPQPPMHLQWLRTLCAAAHQ